jgi:hypothetical protein
MQVHNYPNALLRTLRPMVLVLAFGMLAWPAMAQTVDTAYFQPATGVHQCNSFAITAEGSLPNSAYGLDSTRFSVQQDTVVGHFYFSGGIGSPTITPFTESVTIQPQPEGDYVAKAVVYDSGMPEDSVAETQDTLSVQPLAQFEAEPNSLSGSAPLYCTGDTVGLNNQTNGSSNATYEWRINGNSFSTAEDTAFVPGMAAQTTIELIVDNGGGCVDTAAQLIQPADPPTLSTSVARQACNGASVATLTASGAGLNPPFSFRWSTGDTTSGVASDTLRNLGPGTYTVGVTKGSCLARDTLQVDSVPAPTADFDTVLVVDLPPRFENASMNADSIQWFINGNDTSAQDTFAPPEGRYELCLQAFNQSGCTDSVCDTVDIVLSRSERQAAAGVRLGPNPVQEQLELAMQEPVYRRAELLSVTGRQVASWPLTRQREQTLPLRGVPQGVYLLRLRGEAGTLTRRVMVR